VLQVLGKREDGFHELDTEFVTLALHDRLELDPGEGGFSLEVTGAPASEVPVQDNLVLRAAHRLQEALGSEACPGAAFRLEKRTPAAAGLGGGSSDAAGALLGLCRLFGLAPPEGLLAEIALELGSDVPYFLVGGRCRGRGRGERLEELPDRPDCPVVLLVTHERLSTAAVFKTHAELEEARKRACENSEDPALTRRKTSRSLDSVAWWQATEHCLENDLRDSALKLSPRLAEVETRLMDLAPPERVGLTGSGPTLFALLRPGEAGEGIDRMRSRLERDDAELILTRSLGRRELNETRFAP